MRQMKAYLLLKLLSSFARLSRVAVKTFIGRVQANWGRAYVLGDRLRNGKMNAYRDVRGHRHGAIIFLRTHNSVI